MCVHNFRNHPDWISRVQIALIPYTVNKLLFGLYIFADTVYIPNIRTVVGTVCACTQFPESSWLNIPRSNCIHSLYWNKLLFGLYIFADTVYIPNIRSIFTIRRDYCTTFLLYRNIDSIFWLIFGCCQWWHCFGSSIIIITLVSKIILLDIFNFLIRKITNCVFILEEKRWPGNQRKKESFIEMCNFVRFFYPNLPRRAP